VTDLKQIIILILIIIPTAGCGQESEFPVDSEDFSANSYALNQAALEDDDAVDTTPAGAKEALGDMRVQVAPQGPQWVNLSRKSSLWQRTGGAKSQAKVSGRLYGGAGWNSFVGGYEDRENDTWAVSISTCDEEGCEEAVVAEIPVECRRSGRAERTTVSCKGHVKIDGNDARVRFRSELGPRPALLIFTYKGTMSHEFVGDQIESELSIESLDRQCESGCQKVINLPIDLERRGPRLNRFFVQTP